MKKPIRALFFFALFAPLFCVAQKKAVGHGLTVGIFGNQPEYENNGAPLPQNGYLYGGKSLAEKAAFSVGYRAGLDRGKWDFRAGGQFKAAFFNVICDCSTWPSEHDPNNPGTYQRDPDLDDFIKSRLVFMEFPLTANRYLTKKGKLSVHFGVAPAFGFVKNVDSKTLLLQKKDGTSVGFYQKKASARAGFGMKLSKKIRLDLFVNHDFGSFKLEQTSVVAKRNGVGLELGLGF